jgi:hypothetical protein
MYNMNKVINAFNTLFLLVLVTGTFVFAVCLYLQLIN